MIKVGDKVRSYDFPDGRRTSFIEGRVTGFHQIEDCSRYEIKVERIVACGEEHPVENDYTVYPPLNGTPKSTGGVTNGVELLESA